MENIVATVTKSWTGKSYVITIAPNLISHETWNALGDNLDKSEIEYRLKSRLASVYGLTTTQEMIETANDVRCSTYRYEDGLCTLTASTMTDIQNWSKKFENKITILIQD